MSFRTRVTDNLLYDQGTKAVSKTRGKMVEDQEKAVTGKRVNRPSDDPVATVRALGVKQDLKRSETVLRNLELAESMIDLSDSSLGEMTDLLTRAKELALQASSTTNQTSEARSALANEVEQLFMRAVQIGNTRLGDTYIFGGYQTNRAPFDQDGNYYGDQGVMNLELGKDQLVSMNLPGNKVFLGVNKLTPGAVDIRQDPDSDAEFTPVPEPDDVLSRGPASVEGGAISSPRREETEGQNVFRSLKILAEGLRSGETHLLQGSIDTLDAAFKQVVENRASLGARQNIVQVGKEALDSSNVRNKTMLSRMEDADAFEVFTNLAKNDNALQASLKTSEKLISTSLLDFLK